MKNFTLANLMRSNVDYYMLKAGATGRHIDFERYPESFPWLTTADTTVAKELMYILEGVTGSMSADFDQDFFDAVDEYCYSHPVLGRKMKQVIKELIWGC